MTAHRLVVYPARGRRREEAPAVLVCHGFIQNRLAFSSPGRSLFAYLAERGFSVYALELMRDGPNGTIVAEGLHTYAEEVAPAALSQVLRRHRRVGFVGHSMGGLVGVCLPDDVRAELSALALVGVPLSPGASLTGAYLTQRAVALAARRLARTGVRFPGRFLGRTFMALRPVLDHPLARYPFQVWAPGALPRDELAFALTQGFSDDSLAAFADLLELGVTGGRRAGRLDVEERLSSLTQPVLVVGGDLDGLAPPTSTRALFERVGAAKKRYVLVGRAGAGRPFGHIDLLVGEAAPAHVWPHLLAFLEETVLTRRVTEAVVPAG